MAATSSPASTPFMPALVACKMMSLLAAMSCHWRRSTSLSFEDETSSVIDVGHEQGKAPTDRSWSALSDVSSASLLDQEREVTAIPLAPRSAHAAPAALAPPPEPITAAVRPRAPRAR